MWNAGGSVVCSLSVAEANWVLSLPSYRPKFHETFHTWRSENLMHVSICFSNNTASHPQTRLLCQHSEIVAEVSGYLTPPVHK